MVHNLDIRQHEIFFHGWNLAILLESVTLANYLYEYKEEILVPVAAPMTGLSKASSQRIGLSALKVCLYNLNGLLFKGKNGGGSMR